MTKVKKIVVLMVVCALAACAKPKIIPDDELVMIFHDAYLTNAYVDSRSVRVDSLNIYEPLFARYGYTSEDVQFTIGNFAKRKSARLSDIVDDAIAMLGAESRFYSGRIAILDTVRRIAAEKFVSTAYTSERIRARRIADTSLLRITMPAREGTYELSYSYLIDSTDNNNPRSSRFYFLDSIGGRERGVKTQRLRKMERERVTVTLSADSLANLLVLDMNGYSDGMETPAFTIDSLTVRYYLPDRVALDSMARGWFDYRMLDSLSKLHETHLVPPLADTVGLSSR